MPTIRFARDADHPPRFTAKELARLDAMTPEDVEAAARDDADNPPLTDRELALMTSARIVRDARRSAGLSQAQFARRFRINHARLRDLERGRSKADSALTAYLKVIASAPDTVIAALAQ
ncbi:MAG: helix-turn-helix domain-containing protein [Caulobacteraceae bacterium]|nr:helix-turn-helix domain-containing protein [Caulobacteraceae bacterium]